MAERFRQISAALLLMGNTCVLLQREDRNGGKAKKQPNLFSSAGGLRPLGAAPEPQVAA